MSIPDPELAQAIAGQPAASGTGLGWSLAMRGRLAEATECLAEHAPTCPVAPILCAIVRQWQHPASPPPDLPDPATPAARWALALAQRHRGLPPCAPPPGDDPVSAEHQRLHASSVSTPQAALTLRHLAQRPDAVGARAALDLGARTPDRLLATRLLGDGLARARKLDQRLTVAHALRLLAQRAIADGRAAEALPLLHRALKLDTNARSLADELLTRRHLDGALVALHRDEARLDALAAWRQAAERAGDVPLEGWICSALGHTALRTRRHTLAAQALARAAEIARAAGDRPSVEADVAALRQAARFLPELPPAAQVWLSDDAMDAPAADRL